MCLSSTQASLWGAIFAITIADSQLASISVLIMLTIGGVTSSTMSALTPRFWLSVVNIGLLLVPSIIVSITIQQHYPMALLLAIYLGYLILFGRKAHAEYIRAFDIEYELETQRQELEHINKIDSLTMIYNRGHFNTAFEVQWNTGIRNQQEQSLLMIDIDHFKSINDNYGHLFGDKCLIDISHTINTIAKRKTDLIARFGGEEFAILLSNTSLRDACNIAEEIREQIESQQLCFKGTVIKVTTSIGVSCLLPQAGINQNRLIDLADKAMYRAKDEGRNCVRYVGNMTDINEKTVINNC